MEYASCVTSLILNKQKDERFLFPSYLVPIPDMEETGVLDSHYVCEIEDKKEDLQADYFWKGIPIGMIRDSMGCDNKDIAKNLVEESILHIPLEGHIVDAYIYRPFQREKKLPCIVYFHGGAYAGGSCKVTKNLCRSLCDREGTVVVNVNYRLAPEYPFPSGMHDCWECLDWLYKEAESYNIDYNEISVAGDSAGGNFAIHCCMRDHLLGLSRIKRCYLYYPHVSMIETEEYPWSLEMYDIGNKDKVNIVKNMLGLKEVIRLSEFYYLQEQGNKESPDVSPLLCEDLSWMPPTLIITAEFDYLRIQQEYFAKRLYEAGVPIKMIQYKGMQHAFMDRIGNYPQAEAAVVETCVFHKDRKE